MKSLIDEFNESFLRPKDQELETAIALLKLCREYLNNHYKKSVFGERQKGILDLLDEFLEDQEKRRLQNESDSD